MRPACDLRRLHRAFDNRLLRLSLVVSATTPMERDRMAAHFSLELFNAWDSFSRSLCLSILVGTSASSGRIQAASLPFPCNSEDSALRACFVTMNPHLTPPSRIRPRDEPDWYDSQVMLTLAAGLRFSNLREISAAASIRGRTLKDLRTLRNYYAHKAEATALHMENALTSNRLRRGMSPSSLVFEREPRSHAPFWKIFLFELRQRARLAIP